jgi:hypothetical protein
MPSQQSPPPSSVMLKHERRIRLDRRSDEQLWSRLGRTLRIVRPSATPSSAKAKRGPAFRSGPTRLVAVYSNVSSSLPTSMARSASSPPG